jgi:uncharacterized protein YehS (DUF1456 family)
MVRERKIVTQKHLGINNNIMQIKKTYKLKIKEDQMIEITEEQALSLFRSLESIFGTKECKRKDTTSQDWLEFLKRPADNAPKDQSPYRLPNPLWFPWAGPLTSVKIN